MAVTVAQHPAKPSLWWAVAALAAAGAADMIWEIEVKGDG